MTGFGGRVKGRSFGVAPDRPARFDVTKLVPMLEDIHARLSGVVIECLPYEEFIPRYDRPATLFYLDPPYFKSEKDYGKGLFERSDFERLSTLLRAVKGRFIMSLNDAPETRKTFAWARLTPVKTRYTVKSRGSSAVAAELLITGPNQRPK